MMICEYTTYICWHKNNQKITFFISKINELYNISTIKLNNDSIISPVFMKDTASEPGQ